MMDSPAHLCILCAGRKFKKSIEKDKTTLEFAPTNLHIQQMKVTVGERESMCQCISFIVCIFNEILCNYNIIILNTVVCICSNF